jgi:hypothetical protein
VCLVGISECPIRPRPDTWSLVVLRREVITPGRRMKAAMGLRSLNIYTTNPDASRT